MNKISKTLIIKIHDKAIRRIASSSKDEWTRGYSAAVSDIQGVIENYKKEIEKSKQ